MTYHRAETLTLTIGVGFSALVWTLLNFSNYAGPSTAVFWLPALAAIVGSFVSEWREREQRDAEPETAMADGGRDAAVVVRGVSDETADDIEDELDGVVREDAIVRRGSA